MIPHKNLAHKEPFKLCTSCDIMVSYIWYLCHHMTLIHHQLSGPTVGPKFQCAGCNYRAKANVGWQKHHNFKLSKGHISFWTSISLSGMPPPSKNKHIPQLSPVLTVSFDANKMCYTSPLIDHNQTLVPTFSLSAPIKWVCCRGAQPKEPPRRSPSLNYNDWFIDWISFKCPTVHNISRLSKKASNAEIPSESSHVAETSCLHPPLSVLFINLKANSLVASNCIRSFDA